MSMEIYNGPITKEDKLDPVAKASFDGGYQTVVLPVGFILWRFISKQNDRRFGAFWINSLTMTSIMESLHSTGNFSESYKKENAKNSLAVLSSWSNMSWRMKITVSKEVVAYIGRTGVQKHFMEFNNTSVFGGGIKMEKATEQRIGGFEQYVIPRFRGLPNENMQAKIEHFVHI